LNLRKTYNEGSLGSPSIEQIPAPLETSVVVAPHFLPLEVLKMDTGEGERSDFRNDLKVKY
jgi:hypothetical protein